ncbi:alginate lyase family protein [Parvularcula marina]|uniref:Alginate lyase n=1 Tax=Parvularcula marina TaxID=2292771 RepID=A0A371REG8_9PROT|nr:alginate lyase family protein [Parvularcula marina]RFB03845.1 alginate lyase [Parvularcula marina]
MIRTSLISLCLLSAASGAMAQPSLILTENGVDAIQATKEHPPLFAKAYRQAETRFARSIRDGLIVPVPTDPGGGYTHERHKENYKIIHDAGLLYQFTGEQKYLDHAEAYLLAYADMYTDLPLHPERKNQAPGKLFWQSLNEAVWLVYSIQGYDAIRDDLSPQSRERIETDLLRPMAEFLSTESPETFRKIHNHGTWAAAAVGMTGYALGDPELVERSLMGLDKDGTSGFLAQLDQLFSPDGYYTEGPYYQRYALMPFVLFGQAIENNEPDRKIFEYRDGILLKAITSTVQQSYGGKFFPINDAIREKGLDTIELVYGVAAAYSLTGDKGLLSIAEQQGVTVLTGDGLNVATSVANGDAEPFSYETMILSDGPDGNQGGLAILRMGKGDDAQTVVAKHTSQGMGHGHFDKLALILYDGGQEILTDYGAARFLNVPSKDGGRYLPENTSWAKQTVAHNTVVVNETTHFDGDWERAQESWPTIRFFETSDKVNIVSSTISDAYPDTDLTRTSLQISADDTRAPLLVDVFDVAAPKRSTIDLPFYFSGQLTDTDLPLQRYNARQTALGDKNGYQHLWTEAVADTPDGHSLFTWLNKDRFYTYHSLTSDAGEARIVRIGANDPNFNLRSQQGIMIRLKDSKTARFISVFEPHGTYDPAQEFTVESESQITSLQSTHKNRASLIRIEFSGGEALVIGLAEEPSDKKHTLTHDGRTYSWTGFYKIFRE